MRHPCSVTVIKVDELEPTAIVDVVRSLGETETGLLTLWRPAVSKTDVVPSVGPWIRVDVYEVIHEH